ncbi:MAG TPA: quinone-dependent dihydroorotate dehydrogenase [Puia sp.]|nr:quinone-dependent dihydroorotate dehydrogenase [Puia sp.]
MYTILRNILFLFPPEAVHYFSMNLFRLVCRIGFVKKMFRSFFSREDPQWQVKLWGLTFRNEIGLGAGFDKNARYLAELETMGFGSVEIGTVTPLPQPGNDRPRLFRLPKDKALINRMGFNNDGVELIAERLKKWKEGAAHRRHGGVAEMLIGGNIGKNKITPNEEAWRDYETCFRGLYDWVDYFVVNVSSPNTPGLRELQQKDALRQILVNLQNINLQKSRELSIPPRPLLLKIAPDLEAEALDDVIDLALEIGLDGLVATNTTIGRNGLSETGRKHAEKIGVGGLSGQPLRARSTSIIAHIHQKTQGRLPIIGSGGIFNDEDGVQKKAAGATLLQVWTGFIYVGPAIVRKILTPRTTRS